MQGMTSLSGIPRSARERNLLNNLAHSVNIESEDGPGEGDAMVSILPPEDQLLLLDGASCYHGFHPTKHEKRDLVYADKFQEICVRKYRSLILAWRWLLDVDGVGRVAFTVFCQSAKSIGFREPKRLWSVLNTRKTSFLTLDEWDPTSFRNLFEFRGICLEQFGGMETAFIFGMDRTGSRTVTLPELQRFCNDFDFSGDVKLLFTALDMHQHGFITLDELEFMAKWEGEKHGHLERHFDFQYSRLNMRKRAKALQKERQSALPKLGRTKEISVEDLPPNLELGSDDP